MISGGSILVSLIRLMDHLPVPPPPTRHERGRPKTYSDQLIVKALVVMIIRRLYTAWALLAFLQQQDPVVAHLRPLLTEQGRFHAPHLGPPLGGLAPHVAGLDWPPPGPPAGDGAH